MEQLDSSTLTLAEEVNDVDTDHRHVLQIEKDSWTAACHLIVNLLEMFRLHPPTQADRRAAPIGVPFDLQGHACAACNPSAIRN